MSFRKPYPPSPISPLGPEIAPVPAGSPRPFWSVMIPTYNRGEYLQKTLESVLADDPGPEEMQIEVVDNYSTLVDPAEILRSLGLERRVGIFRQPENFYYAINWNTAVARSVGQWTHLLHDDDFVRPGMYSSLRDLIESCPDAGAAVIRAAFVDSEGFWSGLSPLLQRKRGYMENWLERIAQRQHVATPAIVIKREVYEKLGAFRLDLHHSADWELFKRIAVFYPVCYEPEPFLCYRYHGESGTVVLAELGYNVIAEHRENVEVSRAYLPAESAERLSRAAQEFAALDALVGLNGLLVRLRWRRAGKLLKDVLKTSRSPKVLKRIAAIFALYPLRAVKYAATSARRP